MRELFQREGIDLNEVQESKFKIFMDLILKAPFNLTSIKSPQLIVYRHFIDSLKLIKFIDLSSYQNLLDIGSGAGFPGIPLKILVPHLNLTLLEASRKKADFLKTLVSTLDLDRTKVIWDRAEKFARKKEEREAYDLVVVRALAPLRTLIELSFPFLKVGGFLVAYKGKKVMEEISFSQKALEILKGSIEKVVEYRITPIDFKGYLVFIRKKESTPFKYPRKPGIPFKRPL